MYEVLLAFGIKANTQSAQRRSILELIEGGYVQKVSGYYKLTQKSKISEVTTIHLVDIRFLRANRLTAKQMRDAFDLERGSEATKILSAMVDCGFLKREGGYFRPQEPLNERLADGETSFELRI